MAPAQHAPQRNAEPPEHGPNYDRYEAMDVAPMVDTTGHKELSASMTLLVEVMERPLDPSYQAAADHRAKHGKRSTRERVALLVAAVLIGFLVTTAVMVLRTPEPAAVQVRATLATEIRDKREASDELATQNEELRRQIAPLREAALQQVDPALVRQVADDTVHSGGSAVTGPGLVVTISDGVAQDPETPITEAARVQDTDIRAIVNQLWASGAEAVAVNGVRLGTTSAIRGAGSAILVDLVALSSPYRIEAIGDSAALAEAFGKSAVAADLSVLGSVYGIKTDTTRSDELSLAASDLSSLQYAQATQLPSSEPSDAVADESPTAGQAH